MVAWTGIEPVTRGFSTLTPNLRVQYFQRAATLERFGVRSFYTLTTQRKNLPYRTVAA